MKSMVLTAGLAVAIGFSLPAYALEDSKTGLKVELGSDFVVKRDATQDASYDVLFDVDPSSGKPRPVGTPRHLCGVSFRAAPENARFTQEQINQMTSSEAWNMVARRSISATIDLETEEPLHADGIVGVIFTGIPKSGSDRKNVRLIMSLVQTPRGGTTVTCASTKADFGKVTRIFHAIQKGVTPPR
ncbi:hypothetical protein [Neorhizobium sp. NCHU2750]|uniref:hypothetical protein n=1 Tax=Neorhizobium sp. NCHU2750 TaxID=1825976 RepID=UPI000E733996|nr:hypothetical protein NCHU2750_22670 [Neorhizobium sp. NCHU2750]